MTILICGDVESSGPCPGLGDMISFGLVVIEPGLERRFASGLMRAECNQFEEPRYRLLGMTREQHETAPHTIANRMIAMNEWLATLGSANGRHVLVSDNPGFDFMWIATESHKKLGTCPFGHSARRIGDVYSGLRQKPRDTSGWHRHRRTIHDHDPLNDAIGNAEAWLAMWEEHGTTREARGAGAPKAKLMDKG